MATAHDADRGCMPLHILLLSRAMRISRGFGSCGLRRFATPKVDELRGILK